MGGEGRGASLPMMNGIPKPFVVDELKFRSPKSCPSVPTCNGKLTMVDTMRSWFPCRIYCGRTGQWRLIGTQSVPNEEARQNEICIAEEFGQSDGPGF